jgi:hypothetical protein
VALGCAAKAAKRSDERRSTPVSRKFISIYPPSANSMRHAPKRNEPFRHASSYVYMKYRSSYTILFYSYKIFGKFFVQLWMEIFFTSP